MSLEDKLRNLTAAPKAAVEINWDERRTWWLTELDSLYARIEEWLKPLSDKALITTRRFDWRVTEEHIGQYTARGLVLESGPVEIVLEPKGTLIVGAMGRVDMFRRGYARSPILLILAGSKEAPVWQIWPARDPALMRPLDQGTFETTLATILP